MMPLPKETAAPTDNRLDVADMMHVAGISDLSEAHRKATDPASDAEQLADARNLYRRALERLNSASMCTSSVAVAIATALTERGA